MNAQDLTLPEQLVLLGLEDRKGTLAWRCFPYFDDALAGALLAELDLRGLLDIGPDGRARGREAAGEPPAGVLGAVHRMLLGGEPLPLRAWISHVATTPNLLHDLSEELVAKDVLERHEDRFLFLFHRTTYPLHDSTPEKQLHAEIRVLADGGAVSPRMGALVSLAGAVDLLRLFLEEYDAERIEHRFAHLEVNRVAAIAVESINELRRAAFSVTSMNVLPP
ncbi:MAG: GPP34 family phosphoprotein [Candidatus Sumerlaeia bacterium]|nr:GPP34 family phosphoprotein [Candidatus Sumerlaeia bacterium]